MATVPKSTTKTGTTSATVVGAAAKKKAVAKKKAPAKVPQGTVAPGLVKTAPKPKTTPAKEGEVVAALAQAAKAKGAKVIDVLKKPTRSSAVMARFELGGYEGRMMKPGEQILFELPPHLRDRPIRNVILVHRKDHGHDSSSGGDWDDQPALTAVAIHDKDASAGKAWRHWSSPWGASGEEGAKFAEKRSSGDPEFENEFNWAQQGHYGVDSGEYSDELLYGDAARAKSVGKDPVFVHAVEVQVAPQKPDQILEKVFTKGTDLGDPITLAGLEYGGGQSAGGKYPGALTLSGYSAGVPSGTKLPEGWSAEGGGLTIELPAGKKVTGVDIACGDSHPDGVHNKDGGTGTPGWSRLSVKLVRADGSSDVLMHRQGVPPEGLLTCAPSKLDLVTKKGDRLVISADSDTTYVMALRVLLAKG